MVTKSDQIRALAVQKVPTAEIAKRLGIRYQHAYNILRKSGASKATPKLNTPTPTKPQLRSDQLVKAGFDLIARWKNDKNGDLVLEGTLRRDPGVYVFVKNGTALYVGVATMGLAKRLYFYRRPGPTQKTSIRIKALLLQELNAVSHIDIYTATPDNFDWNGVPVSGVTGLEYGLIQAFKLAWNIRGAS
jgi:hypothetical protein